MNTLRTTMCAATLTATPALAGVTPEALLCSLREVIAAERSPLVETFADEKTFEGLITSIAEDDSSFVLKLANDRTRTISVDDKTRYLLDGAESTPEAALEVGRSATVIVKDDVATKVDVSSKGTP